MLPWRVSRKWNRSPDSHNQIAVVETARYGTKTSSVRRAELQPGMLTVYVPLAQQGD